MGEETEIKYLDKSYEQAITNLQRLTTDGKITWVPGGSLRFVATKERNPDLNIFHIAKKIESDRLWRMIWELRRGIRATEKRIPR